MFGVGKLEIILFALLTTVDQATKAILVAKDGFFINKFIQLKFQPNYGFALSLLSGFGAKNQLVLALISTAVLPVIFYFFAKLKHTLLGRLARILILSGTISNVADRIIRGFVVDFVSISTLGLQWSVFNLADVFIIIGLGYLYAQTLIQESNKQDL